MKLIFKKFPKSAKSKKASIFEIEDSVVEDNIHLLTLPQNWIEELLLKAPFGTRRTLLDQHPLKSASKHFAHSYIDKENCRSNLTEFSMTGAFDDLPIRKKARLFNKCPDALFAYFKFMTFGKERKKIASRMLSFITNDFAKKWIDYLAKGGDIDDLLVEAEHNDETWTVEFCDLLSFIQFLYKGADRRKIFNIIKTHPHPEIRQWLASETDDLEELRDLSLDDCFSVRKEVLQNKLFSRSNFSTEELIKIVDDDPELLCLVLINYKDKCQLEDLCKKISQTADPEMEEMVNDFLTGQFNKKKFGLSNFFMDEDEDEFYDDEDEDDE